MNLLAFVVDERVPNFANPLVGLGLEFGKLVIFQMRQVVRDSGFILKSNMVACNF